MNKEQNNGKKKVAIISLGCDKNRVDTETLMYYLNKGGYSFTDDMSEAEIVLINTCAFIEAAQKEAIENIFNAAKLKDSAKLEKLVVTGCLPMRYREQIKELLPEVDFLVCLEDYPSICNIIEGKSEKAERCEGKRILSTPPHYAYLKIAEGCDNRCTYCTIPYIRGNYRSRTIESLIEEAKFLDDCGVRELMIVAQDVTRYGKDIYGEYRLIELLKRLLSECDFDKLRLLYCYPELVTDELIDFISSEERIAKYIDVPLQHISDSVLKRMGRRSTNAMTKELFNKLKAKGIAIRTTLIVGFPGETEEQFEELVEFVREYKPEHLGVFAYSKEDGTPAARMKEQVAKKDKLRRVNILGELAATQAKERNASLVGKTVKVIYESIDYDRNMFVGRTEWDAPDIDSVVYFKADFVEVGNIYNVRIVGYEGYDLIGEKV